MISRRSIAGYGLALSTVLGLTGEAFAQAETPPTGTTEPSAPATPSAPARTGLSELAAVQALVEHNPSLHVALLQEAQARASIRAEEALYDPIFTANAGVTRTRAPGLVRGGGIAMTTTNLVDLGTGISKTLPFGTVVGLSLVGQRSLRTMPVTQASADTITVGPGYALAAKASLTHPFLRGSGSDLGLATLRQARLRRTAAALAAQQTASQLLNDALLAYWELWYGDETVRIYQASRELAREQERQALEQVASGAMARSDALPYMTKRAELDESVVTSQADRLTRAITLARLLGQPERASESLGAGDDLPTDVGRAPASHQAVDDALVASYQLKQLETEIALARDQSKIAGDASRSRLDLDAYVQAQGLGYREIPPALEQTGRLQALSAHVGLTFETPITDTRRQAQVQNAELAVHIAEKQLEAVQQQLRAEVTAAVANQETAHSRVKFAEETAKVAQEQSEAERARFRAGASIAVQVQQAEDSLRQALLRVQRAKVDLVEAEIKLLHLRGRLLERYASVLERLRPPAPGLPSGVGWGPW
jgi:outer membrane protein TolC